MAGAEPAGARERRSKEPRRRATSPDRTSWKIAAASPPPTPSPSPPQAGGGVPEALRVKPEKPSRKDPRTSNARRLRREATPFERRLWGALRLLELPPGGFRCQVPIGSYFADFAHHGLKLVIELDGEQHGHDAGLRRDEARTAYLEQAGYSVLRFWNHEVRENLDGVVETILAATTPDAHRETDPIRC